MPEFMQKTEIRSLGNMPAIAESEGLRFHIYWIRIIYGAKESLLTMNTKHTVYEIEYALTHPMTIRIGERTVELASGQFLIVPPDTPHQIIGSHGDGVKFILGFDGEHGRMERFLGADCASPMRDDAVIRSLMEALEAASALTFCPPMLLHSLICSILFSFLSIASPGDADRACRSENELRYREFTALIDRHNGVGIGVVDCARRLNVSTRQLHRICAEQSGKSPRELLSERRLAYLKRCLLETPMSLAEIADICGFETEYAMNRFFKRYEMVNPSAYRRRD